MDLPAKTNTSSNVGQAGANRGKTDVVIPIYYALAETRACLESVLECTPTGTFRLIAVAPEGTDTQVLAYLQTVESARKRDTKVVRVPSANFPTVVNEGIRHGTSPLVCVMSSNVVVSPGWLPKLIDAVQAAGAGCVIPRFAPSAEVNRSIQDNYGSDDSVTSELTEPTPASFKVFDCALMQRRLFGEVGLFDEAIQDGAAFGDWCFRALMKGYRHLCRNDCIVSRICVVSQPSREASASQPIHGQEAVPRVSFVDKWRRPRLTIFAGPAWEPWTAENVDKGGIGGSETAAARMAREFNRLGYDVFVFNDCRDRAGIYEGVHYRRWEEYAAWARTNHTDILVASRMVEPFDVPIVTGATFCWVHDIWLSTVSTDIRLDKVDKFLCLSPWHKDVFCEHHRCPPEKVTVTTNGINREDFVDLDWDAKRPDGFIYSSSPERGLDCLLEMWPEIRARYAQAELHVFYGFANWMSGIETSKDEGKRRWVEWIRNLLKQPGVFNHDRVGQAELAHWYKKSSIWLMPEPFTETNSITAKEAMAGGCIPICSDVAALATTVGPERGIIIPFGDWKKAFQIYKTKKIKDQFLAATFDFLDHRDRYRPMLERNRAEMLRDFSWAAVAKDWHERFFKHHLFPGRAAVGLGAELTL